MKIGGQTFSFIYLELGFLYVNARSHAEFYTFFLSSLRDSRTYVREWKHCQPVIKMHMQAYSGLQSDTTQPMSKLVRDIIKTNILSKFEEDWAKNVPSIV